MFETRLTSPANTRGHIEIKMKINDVYSNQPGFYF